MDTNELEKAYRELLDVGRQGGFGAPPEGEWGAEMVLAHVAVNDRLLAAATAAVLDGRPAPYDNTASASEPLLEALAQAAGDWDGLLAEVRRCGLALVALTRQLDDAQAATPVETRIIDGGQVRVEAPLPWSGVLVTHAQVHLLEHAEQLRSLR